MTLKEKYRVLLTPFILGKTKTWDSANLHCRRCPATWNGMYNFAPGDAPQDWCVFCGSKDSCFLATRQMNKPLPCPCCGRQSESLTTESLATVRCTNYYCGVSVSRAVTKGTSPKRALAYCVKAWNKRPRIRIAEGE